MHIFPFKSSLDTNGKNKVTAATLNLKKSFFLWNKTETFARQGYAADILVQLQHDIIK